MTLRDQVIEFHRAFGQPISDRPMAPSNERIALRLRLITEEYLELLESCGVPLGDDELIGGSLYTHLSRIIRWAEAPNLEDIADDLADLDYVIEGTRLEFGIDGAPIAAEVHRSNMAKLHDGKVIQREDGKIMKPANWTPPDIAGELRKQGWMP